MKKVDLKVGLQYRIRGERGLIVRLDKINGNIYHATGVKDNLEYIYKSSTVFAETVASESETDSQNVPEFTCKCGTCFFVKPNYCPNCGKNLNAAVPETVRGSSNGSGLGASLKRVNSVNLPATERTSYVTPSVTADVNHLVVRAFAGTGKTFSQIMGVAWAFGKSKWKEIVREFGLRQNDKRQEDGRPLLDLRTFDITPSPEQLAIWEEMAKSQGKAHNITYCAFNKSIVTEFSDEWGWLVKLLNGIGINLQFATINGLGHRVVGRAFGWPKPDTGKTLSIYGNYLGKDPRQFRNDPREQAIATAVVSIVDLAKLTLLGWSNSEQFNADNITETDIDALVAHYDIELNGSRDRIYTAVPAVLAKSLDVASTGMDYNDQNWLPVVLNMPIPKVDLLLADEVQDVPRCKQEFIIRMGKRLICVGDINQASSTMALPQRRV